MTLYGGIHVRKYKTLRTTLQILAAEEVPMRQRTAALLHRCFPSNLSTTTQGAIVKLREASSELQ